jgi:hypothetical protein
VFRGGNSNTINFTAKATACSIYAGSEPTKIIRAGNLFLPVRILKHNEAVCTPSGNACCRSLQNLLRPIYYPKILQQFLLRDLGRLVGNEQAEKMRKQTIGARCEVFSLCVRRGYRNIIRIASVSRWKFEHDKCYRESHSLLDLCGFRTDKNNTSRQPLSACTYLET